MEISEHLEVMVSQIKEDERKMRHAELRLLQEQINPHFLYNTLDTIIWLIPHSSLIGLVMPLAVTEDRINTQTIRQISSIVQSTINFST